MQISIEELEDIYYIHYAKKIELLFERLNNDCQLNSLGLLKKSSINTKTEFVELIKECINLEKLFFQRNKKNLN